MEARMDTWRRLKRIVIVGLKTCKPNSFSRFIFAVYNVWCNAYEEYL